MSAFTIYIDDAMLAFNLYVFSLLYGHFHVLNLESENKFS